MIRRFVIELEDELKDYDEDVETLKRRYGAEELPHGKWIYHEDWYLGGESPWECSECGTCYDYGDNTNYCGECGADMREVEE